MTAADSHASNSTGIRYEPDDPCPPLLLKYQGLDVVTVQVRGSH